MDDKELSSDRSVAVIERTKSSKRRRSPSSPLSAPAFTVAAITSSYSSGGGGSGSNSLPNDHSSPSISTDCITEDEEEIADCLLLLAKGISPINEAVHQRTDNFNGRKIPEIATSDVAAAGSKVGYVIYECKTCYRTFPSFQALGGHSARHKRPKLAKACSASLPPLINVDEEDTKLILSPQLLQMIPASKGKEKVHECSICGKEFMSGQALGGHMTRHRATTRAALNPSSSSLPSIQIDDSLNSTEDVIDRQVLDLNLSLPTTSKDIYFEIE